MNAAKCKREVIQKVGSGLAPDGWEDKTGKGHILMRRASKDVVERIGISVGVRRSDRTIAIDPFVGIRYEPVAVLVANFHQDSQAETVLMPTVGAALADVCADDSYKSWVFAEPDCLGEAVRSVVAALRSAGYGYMRQIRDQGPIQLALEQKEMSREYSDSLAVMYALAGDFSAARRALSKRLEEADDRLAPELASQAHGFIRRFEEHFGFSIA